MAVLRREKEEKKTGGYACTAHGVERTTADIDYGLCSEEEKKLLSLLKRAKRP